MTSVVIILGVMLFSVIGNMISPVAALGGIAIGLLWPRKWVWAVLGIAILFAILVSVIATLYQGHRITAYSTGLLIFGHSGATALWALIARAVARFWLVREV